MKHDLLAVAFPPFGGDNSADGDLISCAMSVQKSPYFYNMFTSSKTTLTDYQCVSTGCCTHVAKMEITIDNQYVTKSLQRYRFLPKQPKENTEKNHKLDDFSVIFVSFSVVCNCMYGAKHVLHSNFLIHGLVVDSVF